MARVTLLFPPASDPRSPHLAIPSLAAFLRRHGVDVAVRDLNLEGLLRTVRTDRLVQAAAEAEGRLRRGSDDGDRARLRAALRHAEHVVGATGDALDTLRDPVRFYDPHRHASARSCLAAALELVSVASGRVRYALSNAVYRVDGVDPSTLADLARVTADPAANLFGELYGEVADQLDDDPPDVVGISILNAQQILPGLMLARLLKERGHFVVIGGTVYAKFPDEILGRPAFLELFCDALVPYEGETTLLRLLEQQGRGRDLAAIPNLIHLDRDGSPRQGPVHLEDVSSLPTPDFDGLPLDRYLAPSPVLPILTGKGCYFNRCKFCDIPAINAISPRPYRVRRPEVVAADVAALQARYGCRHFEITDEALAPAFLLRLADALSGHPEVDARFVGYARLERGFTAETCERLYEMGMRKLFFGLESGSQATLDHMDKRIDVESAGNVLGNCAAAGIAFHVFSIIGFPEEKEQSARATLRFLVDNSEVIAHPRNSFDIHEFGLDLRTEYGDHPDRYGIRVDGDDLAQRDFPITIVQWQNTRGLGKDDVARLLTEFSAELRRAYSGHRNYPDALWPEFEEYALLYASHYEHRPFDHRFTVPPPGEPLRFRLVWADGVRCSYAGPGRCTVTTLEGTAVTETAAVVALDGTPGFLTVDELPADRAAVDALLGIRALWLVPESAVDPVAAGGGSGTTR
jgi:hypothetical protein